MHTPLKCIPITNNTNRDFIAIVRSYSKQMNVLKQDANKSSQLSDCASERKTKLKHQFAKIKKELVFF